MSSLWVMHFWWWILAVLLIGAELLLPGYFLLWIGLAAAATGILLWLLPALSLLAQVLAFVLLALLACLVYWRWLRPRLRRVAKGAERLNRRGEQLIGQHYVLVEPIVQGRGKARVADGQWLVSGPDLPVGERVEVLAVEGSILRVKPVV